MATFWKMKYWSVVTSVRLAYSCMSRVTSMGRPGLNAAVPQNSGGSTRKIDIIRPPPNCSSDQMGKPFSRRDICAAMTVASGTMKAPVQEQIAAPRRMRRLWSA
jgi:hypothetical protein